MSLHRVKWLVLLLVLSGLIAFEYARHFVWPQLLHSFEAYLISVGVVAVFIILFNQAVFRLVDSIQARLLVQNRQLATMNAIAATVSRSLDLDQTLNDALDQVMDVMAVDAGGIHLVEGDRLPLRAHRNLSTKLVSQLQQVKVGEGLPGLVAQSGEPIIVEQNASQDPRTLNPLIRQMGFQSIACIPLLAKGTVVGVLPLATFKSRSFPPSDLQLLSAIGNQIGVAIENARLHERIQQQANYLNAIIESTGSAIITVDCEGRITSWNRGAEVIYGWEKAEVIGRVFPMVPESQRQETARLFTNLLETGETLRSFEALRLRKSGEEIPVLVTVSPIRDGGGKIVSMVGISSDMREKKLLEQELLQGQRLIAVLEERERFARELHDSLGQVFGYVSTQSQAVRQLLAQDQIENADAYLKRLVEVAQDAHADVREYILSLQTKLLREQGLEHALREYLKRHERIFGIRTEFRVTRHPNDIAFEPNIEMQILRIAQEALTNARKHARANSVRVNLQREPDRTRIEIVDDGKGFDPSQIVQDGHHFGLKIMRERAAEIGGTFQVESSPGKGTRVIVTVLLSPQRQAV